FGPGASLPLTAGCSDFPHARAYDASETRPADEPGSRWRICPHRVHHIRRPHARSSPMIAVNPRSTRLEPRAVVEIIGVVIVYFLAARLGLLLAFHYKNVSPVWPPSGVALAALFVF